MKAWIGFTLSKYSDQMFPIILWCRILKYIWRTIWSLNNVFVYYFYLYYLCPGLSFLKKEKFPYSPSYYPNRNFRQFRSDTRNFINFYNITLMVSYFIIMSHDLSHCVQYRSFVPSASVKFDNCQNNFLNILKVTNVLCSVLYSKHLTFFLKAP